MGTNGVTSKRWMALLQKYIKPPKKIINVQNIKMEIKRNSELNYFQPLQILTSVCAALWRETTNLGNGKI